MFFFVGRTPKEVWTWNWRVNEVQIICCDNSRSLDRLLCNFFIDALVWVSSTRAWSLGRWSWWRVLLEQKKWTFSFHKLFRASTIALKQVIRHCGHGGLCRQFVTCLKTSRTLCSVLNVKFHFGCFLRTIAAQNYAKTSQKFLDAQTHHSWGSVSVIALLDDRMFVGFCWRQNSCRVFKKLIASLAKAETFSVFVSARFRSGCFSKFSRYSLSMKSSPRSFRDCRRSLASLLRTLDEFFEGAGESCGGGGVLSRFCKFAKARWSTFCWHPPIVASIASWVFWTPKTTIYSKLWFVSGLLPNRKLLSSGRSLKPRWKNIKLCSNFPR